MSAIRDEVLRKLDYVEKITHEAKQLISEMEVNPKNYDVLEMLQVQSELINTMLQQIKSGKSTQDPEMESKFKRIGKKYLDLKRAELAIDLDEVDLDVLDDLRPKRSRR